MSAFSKDLFERTLVTWVEVFLGLLIASWGDVKGIGDLSIAGTAALAAIPAALAVLKGGIAKYVGSSDNASLNG